MQVTETLAEGLKRGFTVVVPAADIRSRETARLTELGKTLRLPGFRPGKVPLPVVRQRYGSAVTAEVMEESVNEATRQMLSERGLRPAMQPKVDVVSATPSADADLQFNVEIELLPEITMPDFGAIALTRLKAEVAPETVDKVLADIATRSRTLEPVTEDRPAAKGDVLKVDYKGTVDGEAFPGGTATDADLEVAGEGFIPGFTEQIEGMKPGETRVIDVTFPENYGTAALAGKAAKFEIVAKALQVAVVPPVDDALAQKLGFAGLDALREAVTGQLQGEYDQQARLRLKRQLLDTLANQVDFAIPETMAKAEFDQIWERLEADRKAGRLDAEDAAKDEDTLRSEYQAIADRRVRLGLLLSEIGRANGIAVTSEEMARAMREQASRYPGMEAQMLEMFRKNQRFAEAMHGPIFEDKVVDYILELASVTERAVTPEELAKDDEEAPAAG
ncbi:MAG: trigger factor [Proteobacteria bacterium]|nr:trigger factor [Pseudomonadota bacterium]